MADPDVLAALGRALAATDAVVAGIQPGQWDNPTPCTDLSVRDVLNHLAGGNMRFAAIIQGETGPGRDADVLGDDPLAAYRDAGAQLRSAFAGPDALTTMYDGPFGTAPGAVLCHIRIAEVIVHGWDLARATGQRPEFPEDLAEDALAAARKQLTKRPAGPGAPFAPEVTVPADAPAIDRLAGFLGRTPLQRLMSWTAPEYPLPDEPFTGAERPILEGFLDRYRSSLLNRCSGLTAVQLAERSVPPSNLSLIGIARHLTDVELNYFRRRWGGQEAASYYVSEGRPDAAFEDASPATAERDLQRLVTEQEAARQAVADIPLDTIFVNPRWGEMSLRWALIHMIGEYAGHTGQADLIRERIDGKAGW